MTRSCDSSRCVCADESVSHESSTATGVEVAFSSPDSAISSNRPGTLAADYDLEAQLVSCSSTSASRLYG